MTPEAHARWLRDLAIEDYRARCAAEKREPADLSALVKGDGT